MPKGLLEKGIRRYDNHVWVTHALPQPHRRSIRLKGYDYRQAGMYFFTICTKDRAYLFGEVVDGEMRLNEKGQIVADTWQWLAIQYKHIVLDAWVIMPNHLHGIIVIVDEYCRGGSRTAPTQQRKPIGRLIGAFKTVSTKHINNIRNTPGFPVWQRNYYEHIIRNEESLTQIRQYILNNPGQWEFDRENPNAVLANSHWRLQKDEPWRV
jgi:putative transposase